MDKVSRDARKYTTLAIVIEKPDGINIAGVFIWTIVVVSAISRTRRSTELRFERFEFPSVNSRLLWDTHRHLELPVLVPHRHPTTGFVFVIKPSDVVEVDWSAEEAIKIIMSGGVLMLASIPMAQPAKDVGPQN